MKKLIAILLVLTMVFCMTACTGDDDDNLGGDVKDFTGELTVANKEDLPHYKIAFSYAQFTDKLGMQFKNAIQYLCDAYNCEAVFFEAGSGDDQVTQIEAALSAGDIDGVITVGGSPATVAVSNKYGVPHVMACGFPSLEEEIKGCAAYDNFLGGVVDDDVWAGTRCIEALYEAGCRKITYSGLTQGFVKSHDDRYKAMYAVVDAHDDLELLVDNYSMAEWANDVASFHAAYPELEGMGFSAMTDAVYLALESEGMADGSVKIAAVDISSQTGEYFKKNVQVWTCGGQYATAMVGWAILYNYLSDGTRIISDPTTPITRQYIEVTSYEEYQDYVKYVENPIPTYTADEIAQMIHKFNPDVTIADYEKEAKTYSLEDIIRRHASFIDAE